MARLLGFLGNRPDLGPLAVQADAHVLTARSVAASTDSATAPQLGWGVGFFSGGEILLKRRPIDDRREVSFADIVADIKSDLLVAHVRNATIGTSRTENTHPFRYRHWMFAHTGTTPAFDQVRHRMRESMPQFLQRSVRGETDSELLFHLVLSFLHDGGLLDKSAVDASEIRSAVRSTLSLVDRLCAEVGAGPTRMNMLIGGPDYLIAMHGGADMRYRELRGRSDIERLFSDAQLGRLSPDLAACHVALVASDFDSNSAPHDWTQVPERSFITFTRTSDPHIEAM